MLLEMFCWIILANSVKSEVNIKIGKCVFSRTCISNRGRGHITNTASVSMQTPMFILNTCAYLGKGVITQQQKQQKNFISKGQITTLLHMSREKTHLNMVS